MKKTTYILFFYASLVFGQIPGAVGDGVNDDTAAIQAWADNGSVELPIGTETYLLSDNIIFDQSNFQEADFNGASLNYNSIVNKYGIVIDKPDNSLISIKNLNIQGNGFLRNGIEYNSPTTAENINVYDLYSGMTSVLANRIPIYTDNGGNYTFLNVNVYNIHSLSDGIIGNDKGSSRAYDIQWYGEPLVTTKIIIDGFVWDGIYGIDGGSIRIDDNATGVEFSQTDNEVIIKNGTNVNYIRRGSKIGFDNVTFDNVFFAFAPTTDPKYEPFPAGIAGIRPKDEDPNGIIDNLKYINCTFDNTSYPWMIIDKVSGMIVDGCTFLNGAGIRIDNVPDSSFMGDWIVKNCDFSPTSIIKTQNQGTSTAVGQLPGTTLTYCSNNRAASDVITFDATGVQNPYTYIETFCKLVFDEGFEDVDDLMALPHDVVLHEPYIPAVTPPYGLESVGNAREGNFAIKSTTAFSNANNRERNEIYRPWQGVANEPLRIDYGVEQWEGFSIRVNEEASGFQIVTQHHAVPPNEDFNISASSNGFAITTDGANNLTFWTATDVANAGGNDPGALSDMVPHSFPIVMGEWNDIVVNVNYETNNTGFIRVWLNGVQVINIENQLTVYITSGNGQPNERYLYAKKGVYTGTDPTATGDIDLDAWRAWKGLGGSYADVAPRGERIPGEPMTQTELIKQARARSYNMMLFNN